MVCAKRFHQFVLQRVDVLKLINHNVFKPLLPFQTDFGIVFEDKERIFDQVVIIKAEAFLLLIQIAVKDDIPRRFGRKILCAQAVKRHGDHVLIIIRVLGGFSDFDHVPRIGKRHMPEGKPPLFIDDFQHGINIGIIQHKEILGILDGIAVLLQNGDAETVERADIARVVIAGEKMDALAHFVCGLVGKGHAKDVGGKDADLVYKICKAVRKRTRFSAARPRNDTHISFRGRDGTELFRV